MSYRLWLFNYEIDTDEYELRVTTDYNEALENDVDCIEVKHSFHVPLKLLIDTMDSELENANYHSMVGMWDYLGKMLEIKFGEDNAKAFLLDIIKEKGLLLIDF